MIKINRVVDVIPLTLLRSGFDHKKKELELQELIRREENERQEEKALGIDATTGKEKLEGYQGDDDLIIRTELVGGVGKYGRLHGCHILEMQKYH